MKIMSWWRYRCVDRNFQHMRCMHLRALRRKQKTHRAQRKHDDAKRRKRKVCGPSIGDRR